jgi:hypothetical protein
VNLVIIIVQLEAAHEIVATFQSMSVQKSHIAFTVSI